jgi:hypothetical protein
MTLPQQDPNPFPDPRHDALEASAAELNEYLELEQAAALRRLEAALDVQARRRHRLDRNRPLGRW